MMFGKWPKSHRIVKQLGTALIRLRVCAGWSEPLLVAHTTLLKISCRGSIKNIKETKTTQKCENMTDGSLRPDVKHDKHVQIKAYAISL